MGRRLDRMLEPGERVVCRQAPGRNRRWLYAHVFAGLVLAGVLALWYFRLDPIILSGMAAVVLGFPALGLCLTLFLEDRWDEILLTDRRVLRRIIRDGQETVTEIPLVGVAAVELADATFGLAIEVKRRNGRETEIRDLRQTQAFAAALAEQTGLTRPPSVGRLEHLAFYCWFVGGMTVVGYFLLLFQHYALGSGDLALYIRLPLSFLGAIAVLFFGLWLGAHLGTLVAVALMPFFASAEQAGNWLRIRPHRRSDKWTLWKHPAYLRLASLVYGRPMHLNADGAERHVR